MDFLMQTGLMLLGAIVPLWLRAVTHARNFDAAKFVFENRGRFVLAAIGVLVVSTLKMFDAGGLQSLFEAAGLPVRVGSNAVIGFGIASFVLIRKKSNVPA